MKSMEEIILASISRLRK